MAPKNTTAASKKTGSFKEHARSEGPSVQDRETEPRVVLEDVAPEVEELQETMSAFQEELAQFNARQEAFAEEMAKQRREMNARGEEIRQQKEEADRRHREAAVALEAATQLTRANCSTISRYNYNKIMR